MSIPWTKIFIGIAIAAFIGGGFLFLKNHLANDKEMAALNSELSYTLAREQAASKLYKERVDESFRSLEMVQRELEESRKRHREMVGVFERHDLGALIKAKPGLITRRMRSGTKRMWLDVEEATNADSGSGQPLSEAAED
jgi:hypothetical protein